MKKVILIVTDSLGVGALPDAAAYKDEGADTFGHIADSFEKEGMELKIPNLKRLGFCNIEGAAGGRFAADFPEGAYGRCMELSKGKDTTTGHWEIAGLMTTVPFKTYPDGFPKEFMDKFEEAIGTKTLGNYPASGTEIIEKLGDEHERTGKPIVYTSADSVFQIAANTDVIPLERLYQICETAREMLHGEFACGRVIARPYVKVDGKRKRTSDRHDYSVTPPEETALDKLVKAGKTVYSVGKIRDIFNGRGITDGVKTKSNMDGVDKTVSAIAMDFEGLIFTNLVEFDSEYGHRRDPVGYGRAIEAFDARIPEIVSAMGRDDMLIICADHGTDPVHHGTDHTREYIPLVVYGEGVKPVNLGTRRSFGDIGATICDVFGAEMPMCGESFLEEIRKE